MRPRLGVVVVALLALAPFGALAKAPKTSPRPLPRPALVAPLPALPAGLPPTLAAPADPFVPEPRLAAFRPLPRPAHLAAPVPAAPVPAALPAPNPAFAGIRPLPRPSRRGAALTPAAIAPSAPSAPVQSASAKGSVCGVAAIKGKPIAPIPAKVKGCGLEGGVQVTSISGIAFSQPLTIDCTTAKAMKTWLERGILPAVGNKGGGVRRIEVFDTYSCRPRNNVRGAKVSEHGRGRAIDFSGLTLQNGKVIDVLHGWKSEPKLMAAIHRSACGPFGTVLGPKSDRYHQNHIHVDTARYRGGPYCR